MILVGAAHGQALRTYEMGIAGGKPQPVGPADFLGAAVAPDGKRIAGVNGAGQIVIFDTATQKLQTVPATESGETVSKWSQDGQALLVLSVTPWGARMCRVEIADGKRTLLQQVQLSNRAGSMSKMRLQYAEKSKAYVYGSSRTTGSLYVVDGLE